MPGQYSVDYSTLPYGPRNYRDREGTIADALNPFQYGNRAVRLADRAGQLNASSVWALFCIVLLGWTIWREKNSRKSESQWLDVRTQDAIADSKMIDAIAAMDSTIKHSTEKTVELHAEVKTLCSVFLKEKNNP